MPAALAFSISFAYWPGVTPGKTSGAVWDTYFSFIGCRFARCHFDARFTYAAIECYQQVAKLYANPFYDTASNPGVLPSAID
jgi:hypothetical protein